MNDRFPRTPHCPWSEKMSSDDLWLEDSRFGECFGSTTVVVTEKLDGECTTLTQERCYARSPDGRHHPSRDLVKRIWATVRSAIPRGWRIVGENLTAQHAIHYDRLPPRFPTTSSPLLVFSVIDAQEVVLGWDAMLEFLATMPIPMETVPVLWRGELPADGAEAQRVVHEHAWTGTSSFGATQEGYVLRHAHAFPVAAYGEHICKFVGGGFSPGNDNWRKGRFTLNDYADQAPGRTRV